MKKEMYIQIGMQSIGVSLKENGRIISSRDYSSDGQWEGTTEGILFKDLNDEEFKIGKKYDEEISVYNSGNIDEFVRIIITKTWQNANGEKITDLSPEIIELNILENNGWVIAEDQSTKERIVGYYTKSLSVGESTENILDNLRVNESINNEYKIINNNGNIIIENAYDGYRFQIGLEVDAVQTHNAKDAIKSAWGVDVDVNSDETEIIF